jgi:hypothetical protein
MPVILPRLEEDPIPRAHLHNGAAVALDAADTSVTNTVCPFRCLCQAVRAPGAKCTLLALTRAPADGAATDDGLTEAKLRQAFGTPVTPPSMSTA